MSQENENPEVGSDEPESTDDAESETNEDPMEGAPEDNTDESESTDEPEDTDSEPVEKSDDPILKALAAMEDRINKRFDKVEAEVDEVRGVAKAAEATVEKAMKRRADSKGGGNDSTTKVKTEKKEGNDPSSFKGVLNLPGL